MGCCGDKVKKGINIAGAYKNTMTGKKFEYTAAARLACRNCEHNRWLGIRGVCAICHCWNLVKARQTPRRLEVKQEDGSIVVVETIIESCPLNKWPIAGQEGTTK